MTINERHEPIGIIRLGMPERTDANHQFERDQSSG